MIKVIKKQKHVTECTWCGSMLEYEPSDVQLYIENVSNGTLYSCDTRTIRFIKCPVCENKVKL